MPSRSLLAISATPIQLFPALDIRLPILESVIVDNLGPSAATCYLKIWTNRDAAPDPATEEADVLLPVPSGDRQWSPFVELPGRSWIACTEEPGVGDTASADDVNALICYAL